MPEQSEAELADVMRRLTGAAADVRGGVAEHRLPATLPAAGPLEVQLHVQVPDLGVLDWFMRLMKLTAALLLVSLVLSLPVLLVYAMIIGSALKTPQ